MMDRPPDDLLTVSDQQTIANLAALEKLSTQTLEQIVLNAQAIIDRREQEEVRQPCPN